MDGACKWNARAWGWELIKSVQLDKGRSILSAYGKDIKTSCFVRNEIYTDERLKRELNEVVLTEPSPGLPYMPRVFPTGTWEIELDGIAQMTDSATAYIRKWWIPTNASQMVDVWLTQEQESHEVYTAKSGRIVIDRGYGIHCSMSITTLGCLRIGESILGVSNEEMLAFNEQADADIDWLVQQLLGDRKDENTVIIEVA